MHLFPGEIIEFYDITHVQLPPNNYRMEIGLYIMYHKKGFSPPSMKEISHFLGLKRSGNDLGFYYLSIYHSHSKKGFFVGNPSNMKLWKPNYFYLYDIPRVSTQFKLDPRKYLYALAF